MNKLILAAGAALLCSAGLLAADIHTPVTITGCVHAGNDADTYVLLSVRDVSDGKAVPAGIVYWLSSAKALKGHVGEKVEVHGTYSVDRDYGKTATLKIKPEPAKGEETVELENGAKKVESKEELRPVGTSGVLPTEEKRPYRRLEVGSVKTIAASCDVP